MSSLRYLLLVPALLLSCGGRYDVGDEAKAGAGSGGSGAEGGSGAAETGGSGAVPTMGGSGGASMTGGSGGASMTGGSGGDTMTGGSGGTSMMGGSGGDTMLGSGGNGMSGAGMMQPGPMVCGRLRPELMYPPLAPPAEVWARISRFLWDAELPAPAELPDVTTPAWAGELVRSALEEARSTGNLPAGLVRFMSEFLEDDQTDAGERWAREMVAGDATLASLLTGPGAGEYGIFSDVARRIPSISGRGSWMAHQLFCTPVPTPPPDTPSAPPGPAETRRSALVVATQSPQCIGCHSIIDPLGFSLEILAPETGEFRTVDNGQPIDASGSYVTGRGVMFSYSDIGALGSQLATSCEAAECFTRHLTDYVVVAADILPFGDDEVGAALFAFGTEGRFALEDLLVTIVETPSFLR